MLHLPRSLHRHGMLNRYAHVRSSDPEESCRGVAEVLAPHRLELRGRGAQLHTRFNVARLGESATVTYLAYGAVTDVFPGFVNDKYFLQIPVSGGADLRIGRDAIDAAAGTATIVSPSEFFSLRMSADCGFATLVLGQQLVADTLSSLGAGPVTALPVFAPRIDTSTTAGRSLLGAVWALMQQLDTASPGDAAASAALAGELATLMLLNQPHDYSWRLELRADAPAARTVQTACAWVRENLQGPITLADLSRVTGVPARTLRAHFVRVTGMAPKAWIEAERLARIHEDLRHAREGESVTGIALRWGVGHLARFAGNYRRRYGLYPSETLRTARRRH